jgi:tetratricopeptide (TPR) repeat protein
VNQTTTVSRLVLVLGLVLLTTAPALPLEDDDNLQAARARMEMRAWGDAFQFINRELKINPRSWRAYRLLGEYYQGALGQAKDAIVNYLKSYKLTLDRQLVSQGERNEYDELCKELTRLVSERAASAADGGARVLEQIVVDNGFASMPLAQRLLAHHDRKSNWEAIRQVVAAIRKVPEQSVYRTSERELGWLHYYEGRSLESGGDLLRAYAAFLTAKQKGVAEASGYVEKMLKQIEDSVTEPMTQARRAFEHQDYLNAKVMFKSILARAPPGCQIRTRAETGLNDCEAAIAIEAAMQTADDAVKQKGDFKLASQRISDAMSRYPNDARLQKRFAELEALREKIDKQAANQEEEKDRAVRLKREERDRLIMEGQDLRKNGKYLEASEKFGRALKLGKDRTVEQLLRDVQKQCDIQDKFEQGVNLFKKGNFAGAAKNFEVVSDEDPNYEEGKLKKWLALCYFELQQSDKARSLAERYLDRVEDAEVLEKLATLLETNRESRVDMQKAVGYLERLVKLRGEDQAIRSRISALNWELNRFQYLSIGFVALVWLGGWTFVKKRPEWVKKINLADLDRFISKRDFRAAADLHAKVIKMGLSEKEELLARGLFARAFYECREYARSITECQQVLRLLPENKQTRVLLARNLHATKNISPENLQYYMDFLEAEPQNREIITFIGQFATKKQIINPQTMGVLRQLATLNPDDDKLRLLLIKGYIKENDRTQNAMSLYQVERQKNPKNIDVRVILAEDYLKKGDITKAIQECEEIINIELNEPRTHKLLADAYAKLGKTQELISLYESILQTDPHNGAIQGFLSRLLNAPAASTAGTKRPLTPEQQKALLEQPQVAAGQESPAAEPARGRCRARSAASRSRSAPTSAAAGSRSRSAERGFDGAISVVRSARGCRARAVHGTAPRGPRPQGPCRRARPVRPSRPGAPVVPGWGPAGGDSRPSARRHTRSPPDPCPLSPGQDPPDREGAVPGVLLAPRGARPRAGQPEGEEAPVGAVAGSARPHPGAPQSGDGVQRHGLSSHRPEQAGRGRPPGRVRAQARTEDGRGVRRSGLGGLQGPGSGAGLRADLEGVRDRPGQGLHHRALPAAVQPQEAGRPVPRRYRPRHRAFVRGGARRRGTGRRRQVDSQ